MAKAEENKKKYVVNQNKSHFNFPRHEIEIQDTTATHDLSVNAVHKLVSSFYSFLSFLSSSSSLFIIVAASFLTDLDTASGIKYLLYLFRCNVSVAICGAHKKNRRHQDPLTQKIVFICWLQGEKNEAK